MSKVALYINGAKTKLKNEFPTIQRRDVMECIFSEGITKKEKKELSSMYYEILNMETKDLGYITEVAVSSKQDADLYDLINRIKEDEKRLLQV